MRAPAGTPVLSGSTGRDALPGARGAGRSTPAMKKRTKPAKRTWEVKYTRVWVFDVESTTREEALLLAADEIDRIEDAEDYNTTTVKRVNNGH